jgi:hypothetical protein
LRACSTAGQRLRGRTAPALSQIRQRLLDMGLIYATEDYSYVDFTIPRSIDIHVVTGDVVRTVRVCVSP